MFLRSQRPHLRSGNSALATHPLVATVALILLVPAGVQVLVATALNVFATTVHARSALDTNSHVGVSHPWQ